MSGLWNALKISTFSLSLGLSALLVGVFWAGSAFAQKELAVYISTDREVYPAGQTVPVTYTVVNETGQTIHIERAACTPTFKLRVYDLDDQPVWNSEDCPICCCTCCQCLTPVVQRDIPLGETVFENDTTWRQVQTLRQELCGCVTEPAPAGFYYLMGQVLDTWSDPILIEIQ